MARKTTGSVVEHRGRDGRTYRSLRFSAYGKRRYMSLGEVSPLEAERELGHVLADVERGIWREPSPETAVDEPAAAAPTFHELAEQWWLRHEAELRPNTLVDYRTRLERHLLPFFAETPVDRITFDTVDAYITAKQRESARLAADLDAWRAAITTEDDAGRRAQLVRHRPGRPLGPRSINMTLTLLATILEGAVERDLLARNPARGKNRRVRERAPQRSYLETSHQISALLAAGAELDLEARPDRRHIPRKAILATLMFAGLRIDELCGLRWRDVDLATGWLSVADSKTDAGRRRVKIRGALRDELGAVRAQAARTGRPDGHVFATRAGARPSKDNIRSRVLAPAVARASERLIEADQPPLPERITPHSLRRTFASLLYALGEDPGVVMDEMGHTDPALALRIYRQAMRRGEDEKRVLRRLVDGGVAEADAGTLEPHVSFPAK